MKIIMIAGARPNFMKIAPIARAFDAVSAIQYQIVHTGQHYDQNMSDVFFTELGIRQPDYHLGAGGGSHAEQTGKIMTAFETICEKETPDLVLVVGDVNSTLACSIVAKKMHVQVAHVEAGLRSFDRDMPEEINRMVTDAISDLFFVTEEQGMVNLEKEGKSPDSVHFVGHVMIDNLFYQLEKLHQMPKETFASHSYKSAHREYAIITLHRPSNVDQPEALTHIFQSLETISSTLPLIFPIHPRTRNHMERFGITPPVNMTLTEPLSYMEFLNLWKDAKMVLTDSGGLQEETTALGVPCLTIRENTERPITVEQGTNELVGLSKEKLFACIDSIMKGQWKTGQKPRFWDGHAAERIAQILMRHQGTI